MEQPYVIYDNTGTIIEWGYRTEEALAYDCSISNKSYLIGFGIPYTHYVDLNTMTIVKKEVPTFPEPPPFPDEPDNSPPPSDA